MLRPILLISNPTDSILQDKLKVALNQLGPLQIEPEENAIRAAIQGAHQIIIVETCGVEDFSLLVARMRAHRPEARIIVTTASPEWEDAREAFRSGATDYVNISLDMRELLASLYKAQTGPTPYGLQEYSRRH